MDPAQVEEFYRFHARFYDATRWAFLPDRERAIRLLDPRPGETVIDFACGTGLNVPVLERLGAGRIIGLDYSEAMLARARRKFPSVEFRRCDLATCEISERADKALCTYALSMIDTWRDALLNMKRALRPGGSLLVLDFHPLRGVFAPLQPLWSGWLSLHGIRSDKPWASFLEPHFENVTQEVRHSGYDVIVVARGPR